jgi:hypothetical protein
VTQKTYYILAILLGCRFSSLGAQDYEWWNRKHQWDGATPWNQYLIPAPAFMGPNALPVPEVRRGNIPGKGFAEFGLDGYLGRGDRTLNALVRFMTPLFSSRAALSVSYIPVEYYRTDTLTRDLRRSREYDGEGYSMGDIYVSTLIHLVRAGRFVPDILLGINLKTASGTNFHAARHTDSPGYYFDVSAGRSFIPEKWREASARLYIMAGFYVYQTSLINHMQNDAFLFGAGMDLRLGSWKLEQQIGGYNGYLDNGDSPLVYRFGIQWDTGRGTHLRMRIQQGLVDFPYTSLRLSTQIEL